MSGSISQATEALVRQVEEVLQRDLAALEARESAFIAQCANQAVGREPYYTLPEFPDLKQAYYRQLEGECRLLEKAITAWLRRAEELCAQLSSEMETLKAPRPTEC